MRKYMETVLEVGIIMGSVLFALVIIVIFAIGFMVGFGWIDECVKPFVGNGWSQLVAFLCVLLIIVIGVGTVIHFTGLNDKEVKE